MSNGFGNFYQTKKYGIGEPQIEDYIAADIYKGKLKQKAAQQRIDDQAVKDVVLAAGTEAGLEPRDANRSMAEQIRKKQTTPDASPVQEAGGGALGGALSGSAQGALVGAGIGMIGAAQKNWQKRRQDVLDNIMQMRKDSLGVLEDNQRAQERIAAVMKNTMHQWAMG
jgi:hypothetical protein